jgi:hypothetical protein
MSLLVHRKEGYSHPFRLQILSYCASECPTSEFAKRPIHPQGLISDPILGLNHFRNILAQVSGDAHQCSLPCKTIGINKRRIFIIYTWINTRWKLTCCWNVVFPTRVQRLFKKREPRTLFEQFQIPHSPTHFQTLLWRIGGEIHVVQMLCIWETRFHDPDLHPHTQKKTFSDLLKDINDW